MEKLELDHHQMAQIDWAVVHTAFSRKTFRQQTKISKAVYNWNPTRARLHKIAPHDYPSPMCNICKTWEETQDHIFTCNHPASRTKQINTLRNMEKEAKEAGIHIFLIQILTKGIHAWMHNLPPPEISQKSHPIHMLVREVYDDQNIIGWKHAM